MNVMQTLAFIVVFSLGQLAQAVDPVLIRPLKESNKRPLIFYYAVDIDLPLLTDAVKRDVAAIREACEKYEKLDAVIFLQSDYLKKTGSFLLCKDGKTGTTTYNKALLATLEEGRKSFLLGKHEMETAWEAMDMTYRPGGDDVTLKIAHANPYTVGEWFRRAILTVAETFPFERHDYFLVLKGIGGGEWRPRALMNTLDEKTLKEWREKQQKILSENNLVPPYEADKIAKLEEPAISPTLPLGTHHQSYAGFHLSMLGAILVNLDEDLPAADIAFVFLDSGANTLEPKSTMAKAFEDIELLRAFYSSGAKSVPYNSIDWTKLLADWYNEGASSPKLYEAIAETSARIKTK